MDRRNLRRAQELDRQMRELEKEIEILRNIRDGKYSLVFSITPTLLDNVSMPIGDSVAACNNELNSSTVSNIIGEIITTKRSQYHDYEDEIKRL